MGNGCGKGALRAGGSPAPPKDGADVALFYFDFNFSAPANWPMR